MKFKGLYLPNKEHKPICMFNSHFLWEIKWGDAHRPLGVCLISGNRHCYDLTLSILTHFGLSHPLKEAPAFPRLFLPTLRAQRLLKQQVEFIWQSSFLPKKAQSAPWGTRLLNQSLWSWLARSVTSSSAFLDPQKGKPAPPQAQRPSFQRKGV